MTGAIRINGAMHGYSAIICDDGGARPYSALVYVGGVEVGRTNRRRSRGCAEMDACLMAEAYIAERAS